jgi:hypothetical protein
MKPEPMIKLRALGTPLHHGQRLMIGQIFQTSEAEADDLCAMGLAVRIIEPDEEDKKKSYKRRDLRAED